MMMSSASGLQRDTISKGPMKVIRCDYDQREQIVSLTIFLISGSPPILRRLLSIDLLSVTLKWNVRQDNSLERVT